MYCIRCQKEILDNSVFCSWCGKRQSDAMPTQRRKRRRSKGSGTVYKLTGERAKPWVAYNGGLIGTYATSGEAVEALDKYNASQIPRDRINYTFADIYSLWSQTHYKTISEKARTSYESAYKKALPLHSKRMREIKTDDFQNIIEGLSAHSRSLSEKQRQLFGQMCKYAMQLDIIDKNYAEFVSISQKYTARDRILSDDEIERIRLKTDDKRLGETARIAMALIYTGMRINELLQLRRENVHLEQSYVVGGEKTDAGKNRTIPIHAQVLPYFSQWMQDNETEWLLPSSGGRPRSADNVRKSWNSLMRTVGIENATPHTCRHTAGTLMARDGVQTDIIKRILGHADYATTSNLYTHADVQALVTGINRIKISPPEKPASDEQ